MPFWVDFGSLGGPFQLSPAAPFSLLKSIFFFLCFDCRFGRLQVVPRGAQEAPGSPQERPRSVQEAPKSALGGFRRASREPNSRSRRLKTRPRAPKSLPRRPQGFSEAPGLAAVFGKFEKFTSWLQKASKTLKITDIDESQRPCLKSQNEKRRAGGGDPPWGSQSAARPEGVEQRVLDRKAESLKSENLYILKL